MATREMAPARGPEAVAVTARYFSGLADPTRLSIVELLLERPRTVGEIVATLGLRQARVSNALTCLKWCGYVDARREGRTAAAAAGRRGLTAGGSGDDSVS